MKQANNDSRFDRQASLQNDDRRKELKVCVVGWWGIGSNVVYCLAKQWIEHIKCVDFDMVEIENTGSQFYREKDIWKLKVEALQEQVLEQTGVNIDIVKSKYKKSNIKGYDIIVLALDNLETRKAIVEDCEDWQVILDTRMVKRLSQCFSFYGFQKQRRFEECYTTDENTIQEVACTEKAIAHNALIMAWIVGSLVCDICNNKPLPRLVQSDMSNYVLSSNR